jgi:hypothetical protein
MTCDGYERPLPYYVCTHCLLKLIAFLSQPAKLTRSRASCAIIEEARGAEGLELVSTCAIAWEDFHDAYGRDLDFAHNKCFCDELATCPIPRMEFVSGLRGRWTRRDVEVFAIELCNSGDEVRRTEGFSLRAVGH